MQIVKGTKQQKTPSNHWKTQNMRFYTSTKV